jgi:integrase
MQRIKPTSSRVGDCKSPIRRFDSGPRLHSQTENGDANKILGNFVTLVECLGVDIPVTIRDHGNFVSLKFDYKGHAHTHRQYTTLSELSGDDIDSVVTLFCRKVDGNRSLGELVDTYLELGTGELNTRKKNASNFKHYLSQEGISLDESIDYLAKTDELGRTIPERWEAIYNRPHKLRQVRSIFGRKNILLFKREGWDTTLFGNFVTFVPESVVSQPFTTSDNEIEHIIETFNKAKDEHPIFYNIYLLAFGCGLRQSEIYQVKFEDFITFNGQHFLQLPFATKRTKLKKLNGHVEKCPVSRQVYNHFKTLGSEGPVIEGGKRLHKRFVAFLRSEVGITDVKASHRLRKLLGARLATQHGIYHAAKQLRNSVQVAERYYSDLTEHKNELLV